MDSDLWNDEICALVDAAFETVSRNPSGHEEAVAYRRAIANALGRKSALVDAVRLELTELEFSIRLADPDELGGLHERHAMLTKALAEQVPA